jgi:hypothetical protein
MQCPACGEETMREAVYCHRCGHRLELPGRGFSTGQPPEDEPAAPEAALRETAPSRNADGEPEQELWRGGYSSKAMAGGWAISGAVSVALLVGGVWIRPNAHWWLVLLALTLLPWLYHFAILCYRWLGVRYVLTTQRFIHDRGILRRINGRVEVLDMDDITFEQTLLERLAGVGTIRIASHDRTDPELVLPGIENVQEVTTLFDNARLAERRRRGLHVEQI